MSDDNPAATRLLGIEIATEEATIAVARRWASADEKLLLLCVRLSEQLLVTRAMVHELRSRVKVLEDAS